MENLIEFSFTENQESKFIELIKPIRNDIIENHVEGFISNVHRHGLIFYRLAMILAIVRNLDNIHVNRNLVCSNVDFMLAYHLMTTLLRHSQFTYNTIDNGDLSIQDEELLDKMNDVFSREKLINEGKISKNQIRFFLGYSGWGVNQLEMELQENAMIFNENTLKNKLH